MLKNKKTNNKLHLTGYSLQEAENQGTPHESYVSDDDFASETQVKRSGNVLYSATLFDIKLASRLRRAI